MSAAAPLPNTPPLAVTPASPGNPSAPPVTVDPPSQPNVGAPPPAMPTTPPPDTQLPPPAVVSAPPPAMPPSATQLPPPSVIAPPLLKPASSPPPPPSEVISPRPPIEVVSPPPPSEVVSPPPPNEVVSPSPPSEVVSPPPPNEVVSPSPPMTPSDPHESAPPPPPTSPPPSPPSGALEPPSSSPPPPEFTPPTSSPAPLSHDPPPPPSSEQPQTSPPPSRKSPPTTHQPRTPPPQHPSVSPSPPPPLSKSPPSPNLTPSSHPSPSPTNTSTNVSPPTVIHQAPPPPLVISPPSPNSNTYAPEKSNSNSTRNNDTNAAVAAGIGLSLGAIALGLVILIIWCIFKQKKKTLLKGHYIVPSPLRSLPKADCTLKVNSSAPLLQSVLASDFVYSSREPGGLGHTRSWFAYEELVVATNGFSPKNVLGEGGFGYVYKGYLPDGRVIAVKQLKIGGGQGDREFKAEVELISRIHHRHLVSLVGYCVADSKRLLVYEYVPNESLYFHIHGEGRPPMIWATRVRVAAGAARGIAYLHEDCHPRIIHRDIKSSNILLDNNFDVRVSDFGLAKLALDSYSHVTTRVIGTFGYMAPEYASSGKLTEKSDVYSFGVVLLELITGRKPVDASQPSGDESLVEWARPLLGQAIETAEFGPLVDPRLEKNYVDAEMFRMIEAAAACVHHSANNRPRMGQVVRFFDSLLTSDITNGMQMGQSQVYDSAEISLFRKMAFGSQNYNSDFFSDESQLYEGTRVQENGSTFSDLHNETTHILEVDLDSNNHTTELHSHLTSPS